MPATAGDGAEAGALHGGGGGVEGVEGGLDGGEGAVSLRSRHAGPFPRGEVGADGVLLDHRGEAVAGSGSARRKAGMVSKWSRPRGR